MRIASPQALLAALVGLALAACAATPAPAPAAPAPAQPAAVTPPPPRGPLAEAESDIGRTFDAAIVLPPGGNFVARMDSEALRQRLAGAAGARWPTVLFLHGCDGLERLTPLRAMAARGFAVIAPDSFARRYRPRQCDPATRTGGRNVFVYAFRAAEIGYALQRMRQLPWVDRERLFLVGVSEGGLAAAHYRGDEFRARVVAEWTCHGAPLVRGLGAPEDEPVLAVVNAGDPWYRGAAGRGQAGDCGAFLGPRPRSRSLVLPGDGGHDALTKAEGIGAVLDFLEGEARRAGWRGS